MTSTTSLVATTPVSEPALIKTDVLGRMKRTREQRDRILDEYERSGLSGPKFAALCGVKYQTLAFWVHSRKKQRSNPGGQGAPERRSAQVHWLEAQVQSVAGCAQGLNLQLPGGARVQISKAEEIPLAAALVRALEKPC